MISPINNSNIQSFFSTSLKVVKSIGWVALAILALPSSLVGYKHSRLFLGKAVAVWSKNHNPTTSKTDSVVKQQHAILGRVQTENLQKDNVKESILHAQQREEASRSSSQMQAPLTPSTSTEDPVSAVNRMVRTNFSLSTTAVSPQRKAVQDPPRNIKTYADEEWQGSSSKAIRIKNGYYEVLKQGFTNIRNIRGDNYCGLRATLFQALRQGIKFPSAETTLNRFKEEIGDNKSHWLCTWNFKNIQLDDVSTLERIQHVLSVFEKVTLQISNIKNKDERTAAALFAMNREIDNLHQVIDPKEIIGDAIFMEALKLHMMSSALDLYKKQIEGIDVPMFSTLMYIRGGSETPIKLFVNHINTIGITGGAEQAEMCLLGYTLGKPIKVARLASHEAEDFISVYPEVKGVDRTLRSADEDTCLVLSSEDDRHYNAIITEQQ